MLGAARRALETPRSGIRALYDLANQKSGCIRLEVGEPRFATPPHIIDAAHRAARDGWTRYTPSAGVTALREAVADKVRRLNRIECQTQNVVITPGGMGAVFSSIMVLLDVGDEVLLPDPGWPNARAAVQMANGVPVFYPLLPEDGFLPDPTRIEHLITDRTKALYINTPGNPTGVVFPPELVRRLVELARRHDLYLLADDVYEEIIFEGEHVSAGSLDPERVISIFSFSKTYAMTGWRVGYAVVPDHLVSLVIRAQEPVSSGVNSPAQKAAEAAIEGPQDCVRAMVAAYRASRDVALAALQQAHLPYVHPAGAFYVMVNIIGSRLDSDQFARRLVEEEAVAVAPGLAFGTSGRDFVRVSLASEREDIVEGIRRIRRLIDRLR